MISGYQDVQKIMKENMDTAMKSVGAVSKGVQALAIEATDYSKKSVEDGTRFVEKLLGAKSLDAAVEVQTEFFKKSYEDAVSRATKMTELYMDLAKEMSRPYEGLTSKLQK